MPSSEIRKRSCSKPVNVTKREDGSSVIVGYASVFYDGTPETEYDFGYGKERVMPGAFDQTLGADVRCLFNHEPNLLLGRTKAGTCRLSVDSIGLRYECDPPANSIGADLVVSLERGDVTGSSFAFTVTDGGWEKQDGTDVYVIRGVDLYDVGPVTYPAYTGTSAGVRCDSDEDLKRSHEQWLYETAALAVCIEADARRRRLALMDR